MTNNAFIQLIFNKLGSAVASIRIFRSGSGSNCGQVF